MEFKSVQCPYCGAELEPKEGLDTFFCTYCGGKVMLDGMSDAAYRARVQIKEMEHHENLRDKEYAQERYKMKRETVRRIAAVSALVAIALLPLLLSSLMEMKQEHQKEQRNQKLYQIETAIEVDMENGNYDSALIKANQLYCDDEASSQERKIWNDKRENYIKLIRERMAAENATNDTASADEGSDQNSAEPETPNAEVPLSSIECCIRQNYKDIVLRFENAGFTNIETEEIADVKNGILAKEGDVAKVSINGESLFYEGDSYPADALVRITYHVKQED